MTAKKKHTLKRWMILVLIVSLLGMIGYGTYRYYSISEEKSQHTPEQKQHADEALKGYNFDGDQGLAQEYTILVHDGHPDDAKKLFSDRIKAAADDTQRSDLYKQQILLALASTQPDLAVSAANDFIAFKPTYESYAEAARVYASRFDDQKQIEFYQKAVDDIRGKEVKNKDQLMAYYESQLKALKEVREW